MTGTRRIAKAALPGVMLLAVIAGPARAAERAPAPAAFDMKAALGRLFSALPDGWGLTTPAELNDRIHGRSEDLRRDGRFAGLETRPPAIIDVREAKEVADAGTIAGSINIPIRSLMRNLDKLPPKDQPIVVTCGSGHRSALAMGALRLLGYANVASLAGGFGAWKAANLPVAAGPLPEAQAGRAPDVNKDLLAALYGYFSSLSGGWGAIAPATLRDLVAASKPFQLDVRDTSEVANAGFIAGATNIPIRALVGNLDKLPPDRSALIVAECRSGHRSAMAMLALNLLGYTDVRSLAGGLGAWTKAGLPVQTR